MNIKHTIEDGYRNNVPVKDIAKAINRHPDTVIKTARSMGLTHASLLLRNRVAQTIESMGIDPGQVDHGWIKTEEASIHFRNDITTASVEDLVSDMVEKLKRHTPKYTPIKRVKVTDPHLLIIDPADVHIGKLALAVETGHDYNIEIAKKRCKEGVIGLIQKAQNFPIDKIMLVIGNDILHFDTPKRTTTSGTNQDTDGQLHQIFLEGLQLYVDILEQLVTIADVEVVYNASNHDYMSGYMLAQALAAWFRTSKNITFDVRIKHRKYSVYGKNLICTTHGDGAKHDIMPNLMSKEHPNWNNEIPNQMAYIYLHHLHHKKVTKWNSAEDSKGVEMQILRSPSAPDGWHDRNGFCLAPQAVEGFIHHKEHGKIASLTHYFN